MWYVIGKDGGGYGVVLMSELEEGSRIISGW